MAGSDIKGAPSDAAGLPAALAIAQAEAARAAAPDQLALFAPPDDPDGVGEISEDAPRRRGRPPGARNKSTDDWVAFLTSRYPSPLIPMLDLARADPLDLARSLACTPLDAARLKLAAAQAVAPYLHQKLPQSLEIEDMRSILTVLIHAGSGESNSVEDAELMTAEDVEALENQALSETPAAMSESERSE